MAFSLPPLTSNPLRKKLLLGDVTFTECFLEAAPGKLGWGDPGKLWGDPGTTLGAVSPSQGSGRTRGEPDACPPKAAAHPRAWQRSPSPLVWGNHGVGERAGNGAARLTLGNVPAGVGAASGAATAVPPPPPPKAATASPLTQMGFLPMPPQSSRQVPVASCLITKAKTIGLWLLCSELSPKKQG